MKPVVNDSSRYNGNVSDTSLLQNIAKECLGKGGRFSIAVVQQEQKSVLHRILSKASLFSVSSGFTKISNRYRLCKGKWGHRQELLLSFSG